VPSRPPSHDAPPAGDDGRAVAARAAAGDVVALAQALVRIPSVNPRLEAGGAGEGPVAEQCARWLHAWGFEIALSEPAPGRFNVVGRRGGGAGRGRTLLLNGHLDTVGVAGMDDPFGGAIRDGSLHGRGACDMKGGIAAILAAAAGLAPALAGPEARGELVVALTADEEHASVGMEALVNRGIGADAAIVCEPTELQVMPAHKGFVWVELHFRGRAAHGSRPEAGIDAIRHAGLFLAAMDGWGRELQAAPPHALLGHGSIHAGTISGGVAPSVYPDSCRLVIERRTLPGERAEQVLDEARGVLERVRTLAPDVDAELRLELDRPGTEVAQDTPLVQGLLAAAEAAGAEPRVGPMTAWVDAAYLNEAGIPAVCFGPGSILHAHGAGEHVPVAELETATRALIRFTRDFIEEGA
jgi:acetylornithine deacetylase